MANEVDKLLYAWALLQRRVNEDIPDRINRLKAARSRLRGWPR